jgi:hypothetical protein
MILDANDSKAVTVYSSTSLQISFICLRTVSATLRYHLVLQRGPNVLHHGSLSVDDLESIARSCPCMRVVQTLIGHHG